MHKEALKIATDWETQPAMAKLLRTTRGLDTHAKIYKSTGLSLRQLSPARFATTTGHDQTAYGPPTDSHGTPRAFKRTASSAGTI
ncbi:hypothetical protein FRC01_001628 [Tulasnella sp. 417]|nr:hypothetical protein FRC01_001628 [Tulasnella sp. 417]